MLDPLSLSIPLDTPAPLRRPSDPTLPTRKLLYPSPTHPDDYVLEIDNSSLEKFTTCPRAAENYLVRSRESSRDSSATSFGKLFHSCEELRLLHGLSPVVVKRQYELVLEHFEQHPVAPDDHRTAARMISILDLYNKRYENDGYPEKVLEKDGQKMVERAYKVELCSLELNCILPYDAFALLQHPQSMERNGDLRVRSLHIFWTGRIDAILHDSNALWVLDHKTSSIGGEQYYEDFKLSSQTVGYTWAAQKLLGEAVAGLILNAVIIRKPTKTGIAHEFNRQTYFYSQDRITEWEDNVKAMVSDFVANLVRGFFPQHTKWCMSKYGKCPYHENCSLPREARAADLSSDLYRNVTWNPTNH